MQHKAIFFHIYSKTKNVRIHDYKEEGFTEHTIGNANSTPIGNFDYTKKIHLMNMLYEHYKGQAHFDATMREELELSETANHRQENQISTISQHQRRTKSFVERQGEAFHQKTKRTISYSILSILIALIFVFFTLPSNIPRIAVPIQHQPYSWFTFLYESVTNFLEAINYSSNFFIYCLANVEIRKVATHYLCICISCFKKH